MKKIIFIGALSLILLTSCKKTKTMEDLSGLRDSNKTVNYIVVTDEERDDTIFILTGEKREREEKTNFEIPADLDEEKSELNTDINSPKKNERPQEEDKTPIETNEITIEPPEDRNPSGENQLDNTGEDSPNEDPEVSLPDGEDGAISLQD